MFNGRLFDMFKYAFQTLYQDGIEIYVSISGGCLYSSPPLHYGLIQRRVGTKLGSETFAPKNPLYSLPLQMTAKLSGGTQSGWRWGTYLYLFFVFAGSSYNELYTQQRKKEGSMNMLPTL